MGTRKVNTLLSCGARVTVVSQEVSRLNLRHWRPRPIVLFQRAYRGSDLKGMFLVIGATDDEDLNRRISPDARRSTSCATSPTGRRVCNFILPSIVQRGDLIITISTSGKSPALAKSLRRRLERQFGEEYGEMLS